MGIEIDTLKRELRLSAEKLLRLRSVCSDWLACKVTTKRRLLSLIGLLHHARAVIRPGWSFVRRLIALSASVRLLDRPLRLNRSARDDILWWHAVAADWKGCSWFDSLGLRAPSVVLRSDASGSWGCGAFAGRRWLQWQWDETWAARSIAPKEALAVVLAAAVWGDLWHNQCVRVESDNATVVCAISSGSCRDPLVMHLARVLQFLAARHGFFIVASHIAGSTNSTADALSRLVLSAEFLHSLQLDPAPALWKPGLLRWLEEPQWTSYNWRALLPSWRTELASSTCRTYASGQKSYFSFCSRARLAPLPSRESILCLFVAWLAASGVSFATIKVYPSAVRQLHITSGFANPFQKEMPRLSLVLHGYRRSGPAVAARRPQRLPITPAILRLLHAV